MSFLRLSSRYFSPSNFSSRTSSLSSSLFVKSSSCISSVSYSMSTKQTSSSLHQSHISNDSSVDPYTIQQSPESIKTSLSKVKLPPKQHFKAKVKSITRKTPTVKEVLLDVSNAPDSKFDFVPGQWVDVILKKNDKEFITGFSMTSTPLKELKDGNEIHLAVKITEHPITQYIHNELKEGDYLDIAGPDGLYYYDSLEKPARKYVMFVAGGIGITPIMSMIRTIKEKSIKDTEFRIIYSAQNVEELCFLNEILKVESEMNNFKGMYIVTQKEKDSSIDNEFQMIYNERLSEQRLKEASAPIVEYYSSDEYKSTNRGCLVYICGPAKMNEFVDETLTKLGVPSHDIIYEKW